MLAILLIGLTKEGKPLVDELNGDTIVVTTGTESGMSPYSETLLVINPGLRPHYRTQISSCSVCRFA